MNPESTGLHMHSSLPNIFTDSVLTYEHPQYKTNGSYTR